MNFIFNFLKNTLGFLQFYCALMSPLMIVFWAFKFMKLSFVPVIAPFFDAMNFVGSNFFSKTIQFNAQMIDVSYIASSISFLIFYAVFSILQNNVEFAQTKFNYRVKQVELKLDRREEEKALAQVTLEIRKFTKYMVMLELELSYYVNQVLMDTTDEDLILIRKNSYNRLFDIMKAYNANNIGFLRGKAYFVCNDFEAADKFILKLISQLKKISEENNQNGIKTDFTLVADALLNTDEIALKARELEKLSQSKYLNEFIATNEFRMRYDLNYIKRFNFNIKAVHRVYIDDELQNFREFELYRVKADK